MKRSNAWPPNVLPNGTDPHPRLHSHFTRVAALVVLWIGVSAGCKDQPAGDPTSRPPLRTVEVMMGGRAFTLEVADTVASQQYGLMRRDSMPADHGMLFVFPDEQPRGFWMKNTRIPLDIVYIAADGRIVSVKSMKPYDERSVPSDGPAKYAIEVNAGIATGLGLKAGDRIEIPSDAREPRD